MKYRKKPVEVEAMRWPDAVPEGENNYDYCCQAAAIHRWVNDNGGKTEIINDDGNVCVVIMTLEGAMRISPGDYVIQGVAGEFYPCKPDIFAATYEPVDG